MALESLRRWLSNLGCPWEAFISEATFQRWIDYHCLRVQFPRYTGDNFWLGSEVLQKEERNRFSTVCVFGLQRKLASISKSQYGWTASIKLKFPTAFISETVQRDCVGRSLLCASKFGDLDIAQTLLDTSVGVSTTDLYETTPLRAGAGYKQWPTSSSTFQTPPSYPLHHLYPRALRS